jgi:hypothetical protein
MKTTFVTTPRWECLPSRVEDAIPFHIFGVGAITQDILMPDHSVMQPRSDMARQARGMD